MVKTDKRFEIEVDEMTEDTITRTEFNAYIAVHADDIATLKSEVTELLHEVSRFESDGVKASKAGKILAEEFSQRRAAEVGSDAYQMAKKAYMEAESARTAFIVLMDYLFQIYDLDEQVDYLAARYRSLDDQLESLRGRIDMKVDSKLASTFGIAVGARSPEEEAKEKGPLLQRIASNEQKLNSLRPIASELRKDGKFLEDYERFRDDTRKYHRILIDHLQKKKSWWKFW